MYSTVDIGSGSPTWLREGGNVLNFAVVQSLSYRPVDNVLLVGTHGNGLYYTFLGTPNFNPGTIPPNPNPTIFISRVLPTLATNSIQYKKGDLNSVSKISVMVFNMKGQMVIKSERSYIDGSVDISSLSSGIYILSISSEDGKHSHRQKFMKH